MGLLISVTKVDFTGSIKQRLIRRLLHRTPDKIQNSNPKKQSLNKRGWRSWLKGIKDGKVLKEPRDGLSSWRLPLTYKKREGPNLNQTKECTV